MKPETKALRYIEEGDRVLLEHARNLKGIRTEMEDALQYLDRAIQALEDQSGGVILAREELERARKGKHDKS